MGIRQTQIKLFRTTHKLSMTGLATLLVASACSGGTPPRWDDVHRSTEFYHSTSRLQAREPVYGRLMWSHLPEPQVPRSKSDAPLIDPKFSFEMPDTNLKEAIEVLAQSIGYQWEYPKRLESRPMSIHMVGTVSEILQEICKQAHVHAELDTTNRVIYVKSARWYPG